MSLTTDLRRCFSSLRLPFSLGVIAFSLGATLLLFVGLAIGLYSLIVATDLITLSWLESLAGLGGAVIMLVLGWFLFPSVSTAFAGLFVEALTDRIEQQQYQALPSPRAIGWGEQLRTASIALRRALGLNVIVLPFYLVPGLNLLIYFFLNGKLLAREYFFAITLRHVSLVEAGELYASHKWPLFQRGLVIAGLFIIPGVNLLAPVLATALMTHFLWGPDGPLRLRLAFAPSNVLPTQRNGTTFSGTG